MAENDDVSLEGRLARVRQRVGPLPIGPLPALASNEGPLSSKDWIGLVEVEYKAISDRGDREERQSQLAIEERRLVLEHEERKAIREKQEREAQHQADCDREKRLADKEERDATDKAAVEKENRRHLRIALYVAAFGIAGLVGFFYHAADATGKAEISKQTLTVVFGGVTGAVGYFFGSKEKAKDK